MLQDWPLQLPCLVHIGAALTAVAGTAACAGAVKLLQAVTAGRLPFMLQVCKGAAAAVRAQVRAAGCGL